MTNSGSIDDKGGPVTAEDASLGEEIQERLDRLEALVDEQRQLIESHQEQLADLAPTRKKGATLSPVSRRGALTAGGLLALLGMGAGTATAQSPSGGSGGPPFYNWKQDVDAGGNALSTLGSLSMADDPTVVTDFTGENLEVDANGVLNATFAVDETGPSVSDDGEVKVQDVTDINFGYGLKVIDEDDGTVTITDDGTPPTISEFGIVFVEHLTEADLAISFDSSEQLSEIEVKVTHENEGNVVTLDESDFNRDCSILKCSYFGSTIVSSEGDYTVTLTNAVDPAGNVSTESPSETATLALP